MRRFVFVFLSLFFALTSAAQRVTFEAGAPLSVGTSERFRVEFTLNNATGHSFVEPSFKGIERKIGPTVSTGGMSMSINGVQSTSSQQIYTYLIEAPQTAGKITVSAASISVNNTKYTTKPLIVNVVSGGGASQQQRGGSSTSQNPANRAARYASEMKIANNDVMLRLEVSKKECYKGEAISAQLKLYSRLPISQLESFKTPAFNGFWTQEIATQYPPIATRASVGDKDYECFLLRQWLLYPQKDGVLEVEQASMQITAQIVTYPDVRSLNSTLHGGGPMVSNIDKALATGPSRVVVKALPMAGAPVGLMPAVGQFTLTSALSSSKIAANSGGSLTLTLSGTGNFPLIEAPTLRLPAEFEQYTTKTTDKFSSTLSGTSGSRSWEFPFIARSEGKFEIPAVKIAYFDPATLSYKTLSSPAYTIEVTRDAGGGVSSTIVSGVSKEDLKLLGEDIRYIKTTPLNESHSAGLWLYSATFFIAVVALVGLFVALLVLLQSRMRRKADVVGTKNRKASKVAIGRLKAAKGYLQGGNRRLFLEEILRSLWGFVGDKFGVELSELTRSRIEMEFASRMVSEGVSAEFLAVVEQCEMAQYAPSTSVDMQMIYDRSLALFDEL